MSAAWARRVVSSAVMALAALRVGGGAAAAQDGLDAACGSITGPVSECSLAAAAVRVIQPRIGTALWGGSPVPGSASTLGMRMGRTPRAGLSVRAVLVPTTLPPITDRSTDAAPTAWIPGLSAQATVGVLQGLSPLPTVGGVLSVDALARISVAALPTGKGFRDGTAWGWMVGARVGALRESLTLPGVSVTGSYGRSGGVAFGDPEGGATDGFWEGSLSDLRASLAASKRVGSLGVTAGAAWDRYGSDVRIGYRASPLGPGVEEVAEAVTRRWSGFVNASWSAAIFHTTLEAGWQESPAPTGLPSGVDVDPAAWWIGAAFRVTI